MNGSFWNTSAPFKEHLFWQNTSIGGFWQFQVSTLQLYKKVDSGKDVYLWILQNF